jgi:DNA-binding SARP family transcriptional activator
VSAALGRSGENDFRLLGPLAVVRSGIERPVPSGRQQSLLAALLLNANRAVPASVLLDLVWDQQRPNSARASLNTYVLRLRKSLGDGTGSLLRRVPGGYSLVVPDADLDLCRFRALTAWAAAARADRGAERELLGAALALWRGDPLAGVPSDALRRTVCPGLEEERLRAFERRVELDLQLGRHAEVIPELLEAAGRHPYRESLCCQLMRALTHCGRRVEALAFYRAVAARLVEDLGLGPGGAMRRLEAELSRPAGPVLPAARSTGSRYDLPRVPARPVGRGRELEAVRSLLLDPPPRRLSCVEGPAGAGKTMLAVTAASAVQDRYPDGQVFLDLHGCAAGHEPVPAADALHRLLGAVGLAADAVPAGEAARSALWRSVLAERAILVLLDDAYDERQVAPLLPDGPGRSAVLMTSRRRDAVAGAPAVRLGPLSPDDADRLLLGTASGRPVPAGTPTGAEVRELTSLCGGVPVALLAVGSRLRHRPTGTAAYLAGRLRQRPRLLLELPAAAGTVGAVLDGSVRHLAPPQRRLLARLAAIPATTVTPEAAGRAAQMSAADAGTALDALADFHLLAMPAPGRYRLEGLPRIHASTPG